MNDAGEDARAARYHAAPPFQMFWRATQIENRGNAVGQVQWRIAKLRTPWTEDGPCKVHVCIGQPPEERDIGTFTTPSIREDREQFSLIDSVANAREGTQSISAMNVPF